MIEKIDKLLLDMVGEERTLPETWMSKRHPGVHVFILLVYLLTVASLNRYEVIGLMPFLLYPAVVFYLAEIPVSTIGRKLLVIEPLILAVALLNPILDSEQLIIGTFQLSAGWLTFLSIVIKSLLTLTAALQISFLLGIEGICSGLRALKFPAVFVAVLGMMYRYIAVLAEETVALSRAYRLRAPKHSGIHYRVWGSFAGQLILRCYDRATRIEQAMTLRGYTGKWQTDKCRVLAADVVYVGIGVLYVLGCRVLALF